ncbi:MAG: hypothetical protein CMH46_12730 [Muricauda sp.]|nr:hypothetical protein [Allomuricauda sp.]|tara:strand:+ start:7427 stop:8662 length:1236 start_codon:yes stop_codon:yes gene_type:complete
MNYNSYTEIDFVLDEYFQKWILNPDSITQNFWESWISKHPEKLDEVKSAANLLRIMNYKSDDVLHDTELDAIWHDIIKRRAFTNKRHFLNNRFYFSKKQVIGIAASFIGLVVSTLLAFQLDIFQLKSKPMETIATKDDIILKLEDGTVKVIDDTTSNVLPNKEGGRMLSQEKNRLIYNQSKTDNHAGDKYNELIIPYGKTFEIILSDGSVVTLNSGSKLRYPVVFESNSPRTVYLEGEAFFSIEKDEKSPFTVVTDNMNTRVYGTQFNVSSYPEDSTTTTVLIEGSVSVYKANNHNNQNPIKIVPGQRASIEKELIVIDNVDVNDFIGWRHGKLIFSDNRFEEILRKLERHFNVKIENNLDKLRDKRFTGTFTNESLEEILSIIQEHTPFEFKINEENRIIVAEKENQSHE